MRYAVLHTIHTPAGAHRTARLVIEEVPERTPLTVVLEALTNAGKAGEFSEGGVPFGNHEVRHEGKAGWPKGAEGIDDAPRITWAELTNPASIPGRRITLRLSPSQYDRIALAARRSGVSLQAWCVDALLKATP